MHDLTHVRCPQRAVDVQGGGANAIGRRPRDLAAAGAIGFEIPRGFVEEEPRPPEAIDVQPHRTRILLRKERLGNLDELTISRATDQLLPTDGPQASVRGRRRQADGLAAWRRWTNEPHPVEPQQPFVNGHHPQVPVARLQDFPDAANRHAIVLCERGVDVLAEGQSRRSSRCISGQRSERDHHGDQEWHGWSCADVKHTTVNRRRLYRRGRSGSFEADVTEGSGGVWERLHYDWSDPRRVVMRTTDSNVWGRASGHIHPFNRASRFTTNTSPDSTDT